VQREVREEEVGLQHCLVRGPYPFTARVHTDGPRGMHGSPARLRAARATVGRARAARDAGFAGPLAGRASFGGARSLANWAWRAAGAGPRRAERSEPRRAAEGQGDPGASGGSCGLGRLGPLRREGQEPPGCRPCALHVLDADVEARHEDQRNGRGEHDAIAEVFPGTQYCFTPVTEAAVARWVMGCGRPGMTRRANRAITGGYPTAPGASSGKIVLRPRKDPLTRGEVMGVPGIVPGITPRGRRGGRLRPGGPDHPIPAEEGGATTGGAVSSLTAGGSGILIHFWRSSPSGSTPFAVSKPSSETL